jgi:hypothetical protein
MAPRRKPPAKVDAVDISKRLAESLGAKPEPEHHTTHGTPDIGDRVTVGTSESVWTVSSVSYSGREVNLHIPGTNLERYRVQVDDLNFVDRTEPKPKEPPKPQIDVEAVRARIEEAQHTILDHLQGEIAALKKFLSSKGVPTSEELDSFAEATETSWKHVVEAVEEKLAE